MGTFWLLVQAALAGFGFVLGTTVAIFLLGLLKGDPKEDAEWKFRQRMIQHYDRAERRLDQYAVNTAELARVTWDIVVELRNIWSRLPEKHPPVDRTAATPSER